MALKDFTLPQAESHPRVRATDVFKEQ